MMRRLFLALALVSLAAPGCSPAARQRTFGTAYLSNYKVTLYSGGKAIRQWHTNGKVSSETQSDGYYFTDRETGNLVEVTGDLTIEQE